MRRQWLMAMAWAAWGLSLAVCPVALIVLAEKYPSPVPLYSGPRPWPWHLIEPICWAHVAVSLLAVAVVPWLSRSGMVRASLWIGIVLLLPFMWLLAIG